VDREEAVQDGQKYYHPDCKQKVDARKAIVDVIHEINPNIVYAELGKVLNKLLYERELGFEFMLRAVKYAKYAGINIYRGATLYNLVNNPNFLKYNDKYKAKHGEDNI